MNNILSNQGLTSSEANHVTNVTKELVKDLNIETLALATSKVSRDGQLFPLDENQKNETWVEDIQRVGQLFALSAWLKTGIKLKETLLGDQDRRRVEHVDTEELKQIPAAPEASFEAYLLSLTVKEHNEYLSNEAVAAHIGKFVHNFDKIRAVSDSFQPTVFQEVKNEIIMVKNHRLYSKDELSEGFFTLQKAHREAEKVVNKFKANYKEWSKNIQDQYYTEYQEIQNYNRNVTVNNNNARQKAEAALEAEKRAKKKEISNLKIVIPNDLQSTLDFVNTYAKK